MAVRMEWIQSTMKIEHPMSVRTEFEVMATLELRCDIECRPETAHMEWIALLIILCVIPIRVVRSCGVVDQ